MTANPKFRHEDMTLTAVFIIVSFAAWMLSGVVSPVKASSFQPANYMVAANPLPVAVATVADSESLEERLRQVNAELGAPAPTDDAAGAVAAPTPDAAIGLHYIDAQGDRWVKTGQGWYPCQLVDELGVTVGVPDREKEAIRGGCNG